MSISKSAYYYAPKLKPEDEAIKDYLKELSTRQKRWGFKKMFDKSRLDGKVWNHKRMYRIYCEIGLNIRIKPKKRLVCREHNALVYPIRPNICWSIDFMSDVLERGTKFRVLNVIDDYNREGLLIHPSFSIPSTALVAQLDKLLVTRGSKPSHIRVDNGPEFVSGTFKDWAEKRGIELLFIQPGKPAQNALIERFNRTYREDILDMNLFSSLSEVSEISKEWLHSYNHHRPHDSLKGMTPVKFSEMYGGVAA